MRPHFLLPLLALLLLATPARATRVEFSGSIDTVADPLALLPGLGSPFSGSAEYDPTAFWVNPFLPATIFVWPGDAAPIFGFPCCALGTERLVVTGKLGARALSPPSLGPVGFLPSLIIEDNGALGFHAPRDLWSIGYSLQVDVPGVGPVSAACGANLTDPTLAAISGPGFFTPTDLSAFPSARFECGIPGPTGMGPIASVSGEITHWLVTPEPAARWLLALAALALLAGTRANAIASSEEPHAQRPQRPGSSSASIVTVRSPPARVAGSVRMRAATVAASGTPPAANPDGEA